MADTGIYATTAQIQAKAGAGQNVTLSAEGYTNVYIAEAENYINIVTRHIWAATTAAFALLDAGTRNLLKEAASNIAASYVIATDMSGYTSRFEAQLMLDFYRDRTNECIKLLLEKTHVNFIATPS